MESKPFGIVGWISVLAAIGGIIASILLAFNLSGLTESNEELAASLQEKRGMYAKMADSELTVEYLQQMLHSAKEAGEYVAESINASHDTVWNASGGNVDWTDVYSRSKACLSGVNAYFPNTTDNGASWYACHDSETGDKSKWTFMTTYSFSARKTDCVWLCRRQSDNQIMAYVSAVFDIDSGIFENASHHVTVYGSTWTSKFAE